MWKYMVLLIVVALLQSGCTCLLSVGKHAQAKEIIIRDWQSETDIPIEILKLLTGSGQQGCGCCHEDHQGESP